MPLGSKIYFPPQNAAQLGVGSFHMQVHAVLTEPDTDKGISQLERCLSLESLHSISKTRTSISRERYDLQQLGREEFTQAGGCFTVRKEWHYKKLSSSHCAPPPLHLAVTSCHATQNKGAKVSCKTSNAIFSDQSLLACVMGTQDALKQQLT